MCICTTEVLYIYIYIELYIYIYISINSSCEAWSLIVLFVPQTLLSDEC